MIDRFQGEHGFLSNFWPAKVRLGGHEYSSVEHAYQAAKSHSPAERRAIWAAASPGEAKRLGRRLACLRADWDEVKVEVMQDLVSQKFSHGPLLELLIATSDEELVEGNDWGDTFWGISRGQGENRLGKILMTIRAERRINCPLKTGLRPCECDLPRCPVCGYTDHDARFEMDHDRCRGKIPAVAP